MDVSGMVILVKEVSFLKLDENFGKGKFPIML